MDTRMELLRCWPGHSLPSVTGWSYAVRPHAEVLIGT